jgi:phosphate transport system permease protein
MARTGLHRGESAIWLAGSGLGICLLMIIGMIALILTNGLGFFWPGPLVQLTLTDGTVLLGEVTAREPIPKPGTPEHLKASRLQLKLGNRDLTGSDFQWIDETAIAKREHPGDVL